MMSFQSLSESSEKCKQPDLAFPVCVCHGTIMAVSQLEHFYLKPDQVNFEDRTHPNPSKIQLFLCVPFFVSLTDGA